MSSDDDLRETAIELRSVAAELLKKADLLDKTADQFEAESAAASAVAEPLAPADSDDETAARLITLEASASGRDRAEVEAQLKRDFPSVDAESLVARFYS